MIVKGLFNLVLGLLQIVLTPISLPQLPAGFQSTLDSFISYMESAVGLLTLFVRPTTLHLLIPVVLIVANVEHLWDAILWILKKLPFVGIE